MALVQTMTLEQNKILYMVPTNQNLNSVQQKQVVAKRPLAPAPQKGVLLTNQQQDSLRCKRKINFPYGGTPHQPASVARRNARERNRVKQVNNGFATLRQHIPASVAAALSPNNNNNSSTRSSNKKLSKVETLRLAVEYIRSLQRMIEEYETKVPTNGTKITGETVSRYYPVEMQLQQGLTTPPISEASSPTPSFTSESSISANSTYIQTALYSTENYENYEPHSPEDEELLDAIFSWQQQ